MIPRFKPWLGWPEICALFRPNRGAVERFEQAFAKKFKCAHFNAGTCSWGQGRAGIYTGC